MIEVDQWYQVYFTDGNAHGVFVKYAYQDMDGEQTILITDQGWIINWKNVVMMKPLPPIKE